MQDGVVEVSPAGSTLFNQLVIKVVVILGFTQDTVASISARRETYGAAMTRPSSIH